MIAAGRVHFIGIGGYSMSGLALVLHHLGVPVSGSDAKESARTELVRSAGIDVHIGHNARYIDGVDTVVYSTDVPASNPELAVARERGLKVLHRSELLAEFINRQAGIAISGTHGKTTTTSMIATVLEKGGLDPTISLGGELGFMGGASAKAGKGAYVVAEADESDRSFLRYYPTVAVVTNCEPEHLEHWGGSFENIKAGFRQFLSQVKPDGVAVICADDPVLLQLGEELQQRGAGPKVVLYGLSSPKASWTARDARPQGRGMRYTAVKDGRELGEVFLPVPGMHNVSNSLAALAVGEFVGLPFHRVVELLGEFGNAKRRFQVLGEAGGVLVVDDYAHHPTEIKATLAAARQLPGRTVAVFQPQRYTRTAWLMDDFARAFGDADLLVLTDIYSPPGEQPIEGVSSQKLAGLITDHTGRQPVLITEKAAILTYLQQHVQPGDKVLTMGAGDIWQVGRDLAHWLQERHPAAD